jgi:hypothetical protein
VCVVSKIIVAKLIDLPQFCRKTVVNLFLSSLSVVNWVGGGESGNMDPYGTNGVTQSKLERESQRPIPYIYICPKEKEQKKKRKKLLSLLLVSEIKWLQTALADNIQLLFPSFVLIHATINFMPLFYKSSCSHSLSYKQPTTNYLQGT